MRNDWRVSFWDDESVLELEVVLAHTGNILSATESFT